MVILRLMAEMTVLLFLILLPAATFFLPRLQHLPIAVKTAFYAASVLALCVLPCYGFITWRVKVDDDGLSTISAFKRQFAAWADLEKLSFRTSFNWRRYVVSCQDAELTFPIWLAELKELVGLIRDRLPQGGQKGGADRQRSFKQDRLGLVMQFVKVLLGLMFIVVNWLFFATIRSGKGLGQSDFILVLTVCIIVTVIVGWRCLVVALIPRALELTDGELIVRTCFFERRLPWEKVKGLTPSFFLLPEGLMLKTLGGSFLLTEDLEAVDELESAIREKLSS